MIVLALSVSVSAAINSSIMSLRTRRKITRVGLVLVVVLLAIASLAVQGQTTRESIIESREKRRIQLERVLENIEKKLSAHRSGKNVLGDKQLEHLEHRIQAYQHQIEELDRELDEDEIEHRIKLAEARQKSSASEEL